MKELTLAIVGIDFPNADRARSNRRSELMLLSPGTVMALVPEPHNPVDPHAVAVFSPSGLQVGYLSAERAPWIRARIRAGDEVVAVLQGVAGGAGYLRVRIGGGVPTVPAVRERDAAAAGEPDFWPDPDGPEFGARYWLGSVTPDAVRSDVSVRLASRQRAPGARRGRRSISLHAGPVRRAFRISRGRRRPR